MYILVYVCIYIYTHDTKAKGDDFPHIFLTTLPGRREPWPKPSTPWPSSWSCDGNGEPLGLPHKS